MSLSRCRSVLFLVKRMRCFFQVTILVVPENHGLYSPARDSWESTCPSPPSPSTMISMPGMVIAPPSRLPSRRRRLCRRPPRLCHRRRHLPLQRPPTRIAASPRAVHRLRCVVHLMPPPICRCPISLLVRVLAGDSGGDEALQLTSDSASNKRCGNGGQ